MASETFALLASIDVSGRNARSDAHEKTTAIPAVVFFIQVDRNGERYLQWAGR